jgi:hypothetical protein
LHLYKGKKTFTFDKSFLIHPSINELLVHKASIGKDMHVATLALGSQPKQGLTKVQNKNEARESHFMLLGVWESVKE